MRYTTFPAAPYGWFLAAFWVDIIRSATGSVLPFCAPFYAGRARTRSPHQLNVVLSLPPQPRTRTYRYCSLPGCRFPLGRSATDLLLFMTTGVLVPRPRLARRITAFPRLYHSVGSAVDAIPTFSTRCVRTHYGHLWFVSVCVRPHSAWTIYRAWHTTANTWRHR